MTSSREVEKLSGAVSGFTLFSQPAVKEADELSESLIPALGTAALLPGQGAFVPAVLLAG